MGDKRSTYSDDTLAWFDQAWTSGIPVMRIQEGMAERGHTANNDQLGGLADRRGLMRPLGYRTPNGRAVRPRFDDLMQRRLGRQVTLPEDNPVVKPEHRITYPGGYRIGMNR